MGLSKSNPATAQVKLLVSPKSGRIPWTVLSWLALGTGAVFLGMVILSGAKLIVNPYGPNWLKTAFPGLINSFEAEFQTAAEIQAEMRSQGLTTGQPLPWPTANQPKAWFYPILDTDGSTIQALWVYQVRGGQLQRIDQVAIRPLKESFITTPLVGTASQVASVDSNATLSSLKLMPSQSTEKPWLLLEGKRRYGNTVMRYGQILSYQANSQRLHRLLNWSSPADQPPQWHSRPTGDQLLIDHTVGLRPSFLLYQLIPNDPPRLKEISLYRSVYGSTPSPSLYDKALTLAQGAVWSHSLQMMQSAKETLAADWTAEAQTQLDLIRLHAERTHGQTEQTWSSQQQHIWAYLIDGQWDKALKALENKPALYDSTLKRLEQDFKALWRSVSTHLQVHPQDATTQIWGALLVTARQTPAAGEAWLTEKTNSQKTLARLRAVDGRLARGLNNSGSSPAETVDTANTTAEAATPLPTTGDLGRYQGLIGQVSAISTPGPGWVRSQTLPTLPPGQTWYHIEIQLLQDRSGWGVPPVSTAATAVWADSLGLRRQIELFRGHTAVARVTTHGVQKSGSSLAFLAMGPHVDGPLLATTASSLRWLTTLPWQATSMPANTFPELNSTTELDHPIANADHLIANTIAQQLGLTIDQTAQLYPYLRHASVDLTGDPSPEQIIAIGPELPPEITLPPGKTMVFSDTGQLLYSDLGQSQSLLAFTPNAPQDTLLLVEQGGQYSLVRL